MQANEILKKQLPIHLSLALKSLPQPFNLKLLHAQHSLHSPLAPLPTGRNILDQLHGKDLPANTKPIPNPAAVLLLLIPALPELLPVVIHLILILARDLEGDGFAVLELWPAVQRCEWGVVDREGHHHHTADGETMIFLASLSEAGRMMTLVIFQLEATLWILYVLAGFGYDAVFEDRGVEFGGFFGFAVEPEAGNDLGCHF